MRLTYANETERKPKYGLFGYISPVHTQTSNIYIAPTQMLRIKKYKTTSPWHLGSSWKPSAEGSESFVPVSGRKTLEIWGL